MQKVLVYRNFGEIDSPLNLKCKSVTVSPDARLTNAPVETGVYINDCKVRQPTTISMQVVVDVKDSDWIDTISSLRELHQKFSLGTNEEVSIDNLAVVQTKEGLYYNMVLLNCPHTEGVDNFSTFEFTLKFQEIIIAGSADESLVSDANDTAPVNFGNK